MTTFNTKYFANIRDEESVNILHAEDGAVVTRIANSEFKEHCGYVYDVNSGLGTEYEHPEGIVLRNEDAKLLNLEFVDYR